MAVPRIIGMWGPLDLRWVAMSGFFVMWFLPYLLLSQNGRKIAGFKRPHRLKWLLLALLSGGLMAFLFFILGWLLYSNTENHWYVSILHSYGVVEQGMQNLPFLTLFVMYTIPAIIFSPIGEEFFFRGIIHKSFEVKWGFKAGLIANAFAFAFIHVLHHGIVYVYDESVFSFNIVSGIIWFFLMFGASCVFTLFMKKGGSVWYAITAHAGFNFVMNFVIFKFLMA